MVWRRDGAHPPQVCLVARGRYGDWSLPKGKLHPGEHPLAAAVREVAEETGVSARPQLSLPSTRYRVGGGWKRVDYWLMAAMSAAPFHPGPEVDALVWLPAAEAMARLTYPHDALLVRQWQSMPPVTSVVLLVRHAYAGIRGQWSGPDHERPLTAQGVADAQRLCRLLALFAPQQLICASPQRCQQTLLPLTNGTAVVVDPVFDEHNAAPAVVAQRLRDLASAASCTVVCTQGDVIGPALQAVSGEPRYAPVVTDKADGWLLPFAGAMPLRPSRLRVGLSSGQPDPR